MSLYDYIRCEYPLEGNPQVAEWQTKCTPAQYLDTYVITADGRIFHEDYDIEDHSDPKATGIRAIAGCMARVRQRLVELPDFRGAVCFYGGDAAGIEWGFSALFDAGRVLNIKRLEGGE